jgi:hypothetical protein
MFRIVRHSQVERLLREKLDERERVVNLLVEQVEYLRAQLGTATTTVSRASTGVPPIPVDPMRIPDGMNLELPTDLVDEAYELEAMKKAGIVNDLEYEDAMARLRTRTPDSIIE